MFKKRGKRVFYYEISKTPLNTLPPKKLGRPKGSKNKNKSKKKSVRTKKPGRKRLLKVFFNGTRGYVKVDPYRTTLKFSKNMGPKIVATLTELFDLFVRKAIQNNVAEGLNNMLQSLLKLCGAKTILSVENKIRGFIIIRNNPELLSKVQIDRNVRDDFITKDLVPPELAQLMSQGCTLKIK